MQPIIHSSLLWYSAELEEPTVENLPSSQTTTTTNPSNEPSQQKDKTSTTKDSSSSTSSAQSDSTGSSTCAHQPILTNVTLTGGIKSGKFVSHGRVQGMEDCIRHCCGRDDCDLAFLVKNTCFSLHCEDDKLCRSKPSKPSPYHPMVAYMTRYKPKLPRMCWFSVISFVLVKRWSRHAVHAAKALRWRIEQLLKFLTKKTNFSSFSSY